jgi:two-component system sensor histidine kinase QseC
MSFLDLGRLSLRARVAVMLCLGFGLTMAVGFFALHAVVRDQIYDAAWAGLEGRQQALVNFVVRNPGQESRADERVELRSRSHEDYFEVRDGSGRLLTRSESSGGRDLAAPTAGGGIGEAVRYPLLLPDGHPGIAIRTIVPLAADDPRGHLVVSVASETVRIEALEAQIHTTMFFVLLTSLVGGLLAMTLAVQRGLKPVDQLASGAAAIDPDGPRRDLEFERLPPELSTLGQRLRDLMRRLFDARDRERRFSRAVAHELRTPLAEMRMLADVGAISDSLDKTKQSLREVSRTAEELQRIVDTLLALARYESGQESPQFEPVEISGETRRMIRRYEERAQERSLTMQVVLPDERWVVADQSLLRRLLSNLLANAVSHAPHGSTVEVKLAPAGPLHIRNAAPHLERRDVAHLAESFYRKSSQSDSAHAGLGLSLAAAIANVSKLKLDLELDAQNDFVATLNGFESITGAEDSQLTAA